MPPPVDLATVSQDEQLEFINSFDRILSDVDGVVAHFFTPIQGAAECTKALKKIGKKISYVTNHGVTKRDIFQRRLRALDIEVAQEDIFNPTRAIIWFLKKQNFTKTIYVVGMPSLIEELNEAGFKTKQGPGLIEPTFSALFASLKGEDADIGAVVIEVDINVTFMDLQKALVYLQKDDVLFISGAHDAKLPISKDNIMMGPQFYINAIEHTSGKKSHQLAKPSPLYNEFITENLKLPNPERVLFIGDAIREDLGFATISGYKKLLVLSGTTKKEAIDKWDFPEEWKPKYYVDSLQSLYSIIKELNLL